MSTEGINLEKEPLPESIEYGSVKLQLGGPDDIQFIQELISDKEYIQYTEFTNEDRTEEGIREWIKPKDENLTFIIYDRTSGERIGFDLLYPAKCPYKNDPTRAKKWIEQHKNTFESGRVVKPGTHGYGTDTKKAIILYAFKNLNANAYLINCALENEGPLKSGQRAGLRPDEEFIGHDLDGNIQPGINDEGFTDQTGIKRREHRLKITRDEFEQKLNEGFFNDPGLK